MTKYKVKALSVGGKGNNIYYSGDIVTADCFVADAEELVKRGYLVKIEEPKEEIITPEVVKDMGSPAVTHKIESISNMPEKNGRGRKPKK